MYINTVFDATGQDKPIKQMVYLIMQGKWLRNYSVFNHHFNMSLHVQK